MSAKNGRIMMLAGVLIFNALLFVARPDVGRADDYVRTCVINHVPGDGCICSDHTIDPDCAELSDCLAKSWCNPE